MFTGIVVEVGTVREARRRADALELVIEAPRTSPRLAAGASVSVNGACQTAVEARPPQFRVQAVGATLERTTLGRLVPGSPVNLEPSLRLGDELGGHMVAGHVDGIGRVEGLERGAGALWLTIELPAGLARFVAPRGSIAVDGVSLTVADASGTRCRISVIPHTLESTIAGVYRIGSEVNLEADLLARYIARLLDERRPESPSGLTWEKLKEGFS